VPLICGSGRLDVVVNNAGILRDAFVASITEEQWDAVIAVHLKGHAAVLHHAAAYWKSCSKAGSPVAVSVINTASASGVTLPNAGQVNYGAAKAGIAAMTLVAAAELDDDLHVIGLTHDGGMWHTIGFANQTWQPSFGDVKAVESNDPGYFTAVGCAGVG
jgi:NAD(P)-dependent dehydrogenase (short-subunit alcohol dehydrogenase family)